MRYILQAFIFILLLNGETYGQGQPKTSFSHPSWSGQSNIYEVNLRQYSKSGTFKYFQKHLPRLKKMGVEILWFMPITPIGIEGRKMTSADLGSYYAVRNYKEVNPEFGTMNDWKDLVKQAHSMGFKVITDWVANHSSPDNPWITSHPDFYVKDSTGNFVAPFDWTDVRKLNYSNRELRDTMIEAMKFWLKETGTDGFRCDVAGEVPDDFWKTCITELKKVKNVFMLAEGETPGLHYAGFDATYTWSIMSPLTDVYAGRLTITGLDSILNKNISSYPVNAYRMYFTTNHDENSWNGTEFEKYGGAAKAFAVFSQTMYQSIPLIYNGQELPNTKRLKFFVKDPIEWNGNYAMASFYQTMLLLRKRNRALAADAAYKRLNTSNDANIFAYIREKAGKKVLVILNFSPQPHNLKVKDGGSGLATNVFTRKKELINNRKIYTVKAWGFTVYEW
ncbi:alpha-amylase family glycosyl hydrolase [soil metagenome]